MIYSLDPNTRIGYLTRRSSPIVNKLGKLSPQDIVLCEIVKAELYYGAYKSTQLKANLVLFREFFNQLACAESAIMGIAAAVGQTSIPIPVLGAVIGTIAGRMVVDFGKYLGKEAETLKQRLETDYDQCLAKIDRAYREVIAKIIAEFERLSDLTKAAFDCTKNTTLRLQASVELAEAHGVSQTKIIHTLDELDAFMLF